MPLASSLCCIEEGHIVDIPFCAVDRCSKRADWALSGDPDVAGDPFLCDRCWKALRAHRPELSERYTALALEGPAIRHPSRGACSQSHHALISGPAFSSVCLPGSAAERAEKERLAAFARSKREEDEKKRIAVEQRHAAWSAYYEENRDRIDREEADRLTRRSRYTSSRTTAPCPHEVPYSQDCSIELCPICHKSHPVAIAR